MTVTRFIETLLVRDIFSYFVPGMLMVLIFKTFGLDPGVIDSINKVAEEIIGENGSFWVFAFIAYILGYLASTFMFYLEGLLFRITHFRIHRPKPEIVQSIESTFVTLTNNSDWNYISKICQDYVEMKDPNFYALKIDRLILLRNIEVGMTSVFLTLAIAMFISLGGWYMLYGLIPFVITILLFVSSRTLTRNTAQQIFISFYVLIKGNKVQSASPKNEYE